MAKQKNDNSKELSSRESTSSTSTEKQTNTGVHSNATHTDKRGSCGKIALLSLGILVLLILCFGIYFYLKYRIPRVNLAETEKRELEQKVNDLANRTGADIGDFSMEKDANERSPLTTDSSSQARPNTSSTSNANAKPQVVYRAVDGQPAQRDRVVSLPPNAPPSQTDKQWLTKSERFDPTSGKRHIEFTAREINGIINEKTNLGGRLAFNFSRDLVSVKYLWHAHEDIPFVGGRDIRIFAGAELRMDGNMPVLALKGINVMGIAVPSAWLFGLKDYNILAQNEFDQNALSQIAKGIKHIKVEEGNIEIELNE